MMEPTKIIVPIDFLGHTDALVEYATNLARKLDAELSFLHVVEDGNLYNDYIGPTIKHFSPHMTTVAEKKMNALVNRVTASGYLCTGKVATGDILEAILDFAAAEKGDMIILATHGRKGLEKFWLGSVAERVVRSAPCPTLTFTPVNKAATVS